MNRVTITTIRKELKENSDEITKANSQNYFKEQVVFYGVKTAVVNRIAREHLQQMKDLKKQEVFQICEELFKSNYLEESFIACEFAYRRRKEYTPQDFQVFENWVKKYVGNWATCDSLCNHTIGSFIELYPEYLENLKQWAKNDNMWMRRASAVTLIVPARHGKFLKDIFDIADILMMDKEDLVQKGYGWMLKAASEVHQREVYEYLMNLRYVMPRTAFRYALEKMPVDMRKKAMEKS